MDGSLAPRGLVVVSGGQTGADRAALDVAIDLGFGHGGWCPRGRAAEDGTIDERYALWETEASDPSARTVANVDFADGTLVVVPERGVSPGTDLTVRCAEELGRPCLVVRESSDPGRVADWVHEASIRVLNVAGPRESECPGTYAWTSDLLRAAIGGVPPEPPTRVAVWAIPEHAARVSLGAVIDDAARVTGATPFVPHWTIGAGPPVEMRDLARAVARGFGALGCAVLGLASWDEDPRQRLTIRMEAVGAAAALPLREEPHVSLSYSTSREEVVGAVVGGIGGIGGIGSRIAFDRVWTVDVGTTLTPGNWRILSCEPMRGAG